MIEQAQYRGLPEGHGRWLWPVFLVALLALGVWEWVADSREAEHSGSTVAEEELSAADGREGLQFAYGLTPIDLGLLADAARERNLPYIVAGYPGKSIPYDSLPDGPVLTRTPHAETQLPGDAGSRSALQPVDAGWQRLVFSSVGGETKRRRPNLAAAQVSVRSDGELQACPRFGVHRFRCDTPKWTEIRWRHLKIGGSKQWCIWAHPLEGRTLVYDFGMVDPASSSAGYTLRTALLDNIAGGGPNVDVEVIRGGATAQHVHTPEKGWQEIAVPAVESPAPFKVEVAAEEIGQRHFCFDIRDAR